MMRCSQCRLDYRGELDRCPLCGSTLDGTPSESPFPVREFVHPKKLARRCLIGVTIACMLLVVLVGIFEQATVAFICASCVAVLINYVFIRNIIVHSPSFLRMVERYYLVLMAVALLILVATGETSVATYLVPILSIIALLSNAILVIVFRNAFVQGYAKYLIYDLVLGVVPPILLATGLVTWPVLAVASGVLAVLLLALMLILTRKQLAAELHKLFSA